MAADEATLQSSKGSRWFHRILTFLVSPAVFLFLLRLIGEGLFLGWLIIAGLYIVMLSALAIANQPSKEKQRKPFKLIVEALGRVVWTGFLAEVYFFLYYIIFDRENLFPR